MAKPFQLTLKLENREDIKVSGEFSDEEAGRLDAFLTEYAELAESKSGRQGIRCNIAVNYDEQTGLQVTAELPTKDELSLLLHRLRPFILQTEPASCIRVLSILGKHITEPHLRLLLKQQRELYDGRRTQRVMKVVSDEQVLNSDEVLNTWLNAHEYHRDPDKRAAIDDLFARVPGDLLRGLLVSMIVDKTRAVHNIAQIVAVVVGKSATLQFMSHDLAVASQPNR